MSAEPAIDEELEEYPGGILEREGRIPLFLKLTYVVLTVFGFLYFFLYVAGDGSPLVKLFNQATGVGPS